MHLSFVAVILFGTLAASFALALELFAESLSPVPVTLDGAFSIATFLAIAGIAAIEEISKYVFLRQYALRFSAHIEPALTASIVLGALFGIGFAAIEIVIAAAMTVPYSPLPFLATASIHITTSVAFAVFLLTPATPRRFSAPWLIVSAILLHALYNLYILLFS